MVHAETVDHLDAIASVATALAGELELDDLLDVVVQAAAEATGARYAALGVLGDDRELVNFVHHGIDDDVAGRIGDLPRGRGVLGLLIDEPATLRLDDIRTHPAAVGWPEHHPAMTTFLGVPVRSRGTVYGNLYLADKDGGFSMADERLVEVLAVQVGAAIDNAVLADSLQQGAVQSERERISRDLHDSTIQMLYSIGMGLEAARGQVRRDPARVVARIDHAVDAVDATIRELRATILHLQSDRVGAAGLRAGLVSLARDHEAATRVRPRLTVPAHVDALVPTEMVTDVLSIVREAVANVARHADAATVTIMAAPREDHLRVAVVDDGSGFDTLLTTAGHGLVNIAERANLWQGSFRISSDETGTTVRVDLPLAESPPDAVTAEPQPHDNAGG